eukprot:11290578-Alexandrium_andersonii.AAC.1
MTRYEVPDYHYGKTRLEDRPIRSVLSQFDSFLQVLDVLAAERYYSQATMEQAWAKAWGSTFEECHKRQFGRRPSREFLAGV